jgi:hypothetical protein
MYQNHTHTYGCTLQLCFWGWVQIAPETCRVKNKEESRIHKKVRLVGLLIEHISDCFYRITKTNFFVSFYRELFQMQRKSLTERNQLVPQNIYQFKWRVAWTDVFITWLEWMTRWKNYVMLTATLRTKKQLWLMFCMFVLFILYMRPFSRSPSFNCIIKLKLHDKHKTVYRNFLNGNNTIKKTYCCHTCA